MTINAQNFHDIEPGDERKQAVADAQHDAVKGLMQELPFALLDHKVHVVCLVRNDGTPALGLAVAAPGDDGEMQYGILMTTPAEGESFEGASEGEPFVPITELDAVRNLEAREH